MSRLNIFIVAPSACIGKLLVGAEHRELTDFGEIARQVVFAAECRNGGNIRHILEPPPVLLFERLVDRSFLEATYASSLNPTKVRMIARHFKSELAKIIPKVTKTVLHGAQSTRVRRAEYPSDRVLLAGPSSALLCLLAGQR